MKYIEGQHPYGTIKRQWGFSYILTKKYIKRARADVRLIFTAYNLRRIMNIIDKKVLADYLRRLVLQIITSITGIWMKIKRCNEFKNHRKFYMFFTESPENQLKFTDI